MVSKKFNNNSNNKSEFITILIPLKKTNIKSYKVGVKNVKTILNNYISNSNFDTRVNLYESKSHITYIHPEEYEDVKAGKNSVNYIWKQNIKINERNIACIFLKSSFIY